MPVRNIPKNYFNATGLIATGKSEGDAGYESRLEHDCQKLVIFNNNVAKFEVQPVKILYKDESGKGRSYTPDIIIHYRKDITAVNTWKPLLGEIKWRKYLFKHWEELKPKFRAGRQYAKGQGYDFAILTDFEVYTPYLENSIFLLEAKKCPRNERHRIMLLEVLASVGSIEIESLIQSVTTDIYTRAELLPTLWQLIANFEVGINLEEPLNMSNRIYTVASWRQMDHERFFRHRAGCSRDIRWRALRYNSYFESR